MQCAKSPRDFGPGGPGAILARAFAHRGEPQSVSNTTNNPTLSGQSAETLTNILSFRPSSGDSSITPGDDASCTIIRAAGGARCDLDHRRDAQAPRQSSLSCFYNQHASH